MRNSLFNQFVKFGLVGVIGFLVDGGILYALVRFGVDPYLARIVSFPTAVTSTWLLNRAWTFAAQRSELGVGKRYTRYLMVQLAGALTNYACYAIALTFTGMSAVGSLYALAIGAVAGLVVNFSGARFFVFTTAPSSSMENSYERRTY